MGEDLSAQAAPPVPASGLLPSAPRSLRTLFPITVWLPRYTWRLLSSDAAAGLALAALMVPEAMGYAGIAGVPPEVGLYAALGALVAYALTGGTSILVVGPAAAVASLTGSIVSEFDGDIDRVALCAGLAITTGVLYVIAGALRVGWIVNFISQPVLHAFVAGLAISIMIGQLDGLFGVEIDGESAAAKFVDALRQVGDWHGPTVAIGLTGIALILVLERVARRVPAALVVVAAGIALTAIFGLADHGVAVVGEIPTGLPSVGVPDLGTTRWLELFGGAFALLLVGFSEGYAAASAVAADTGERIDADQELIGTGVASLGAGVLGGMAVSGGLSKSAAAQAAGARTQMTNVVCALVVLATLLFLGPLFEDLPEAILAAVVISAVLRSANPTRILRLRAVNRLDFIAGSVTFAAVLFWETLPAMALGVALSLGFLVHRASFPDVVELRRTARGDFQRAGSTDPDDPDSGTVAIVRFEAPLVYANAERLLRAARTLVERRAHTTRLVLDAEAVSDLDTSGAEALEMLDDELRAAGIELRIARLHLRARAQVARSLLAHRFAGRIHEHIADAVDAPEVFVPRDLD